MTCSIKYWRLMTSLAVALTPCLAPCLARASDSAPVHFAFNVKRAYLDAISIGFNLMDVGSFADLNALPNGVKGVMWLGNGYNTQCFWRLDDAQARKIVRAVKDHPRFSGVYYISDEPHPAVCPEAAERLAERAALIRAIDPRAKTLIVVLNGAADKSEFMKLRDAADYIGVDPYPCNRNNEKRGCDFPAMRARIDEAIAAGIDRSRIVPVFQSFGQACVVGQAPYYRLPSVQETQAMLTIWDEMIPVATRPFDMAYSWGMQTRVACPTLSMAGGGSYPDLRSVYADYFRRSGRKNVGRAEP